MTSTTALSLQRVSKSFGGSAVLADVCIDVREGEFVSLLGPSGCGKTTTLNAIAGFVTPDTGDVLIGKRRVNDLPVHERGLGMVFQGHALFPHLTCFDNVAFGLRMRKLTAAEVKQRVGEALELVHLSGFENRFPREISGGQQQRVGLARAIAVKPPVLLLDEPLSNLDAKLRRAMQVELRAIHTKLGTTMIYVTHDQEEALTLSDRVAVMNAGAIEQIDTPEGIYSRPTTRFVADFIGSTSFVDGRVIGTGPDGVEIDVANAGRMLIPGDHAQVAGATVQLGVRSDRIRVRADDGARGDALSGTVVDRVFAGAWYAVLVDLGNERRMTAHLSEAPPAGVAPGSRVSLEVAPADWMVLK